jgi:hypothetical protein
MSMRSWVATACLLGAGCSTRLLSLDAGAPDLATCATHHTLGNVPIAALSMADSARCPLWLTVGVAARSGCDVPGAVDVVVEPGDFTATVQLTAHLWRSDAPDGDCGAPGIASTVVALDETMLGGDPRVVVRDALGGPAALTIEAQPLVPCPPWSPPSCASDASCPFGSTCPPLPPGDRGVRRCTPSQTGGPESPCLCDGDCGFGGVCALFVDQAYCQLPCAVDADCLPGHRCLGSGCHAPD